MLVLCWVALAGIVLATGFLIVFRDRRPEAKMEFALRVLDSTPTPFDRKELREAKELLRQLGV